MKNGRVSSAFPMAPVAAIRAEIAKSLRKKSKMAKALLRRRPGDLASVLKSLENKDGRGGTVAGASAAVFFALVSVIPSSMAIAVKGTVSPELIFQVCGGEVLELVSRELSL